MISIRLTNSSILTWLNIIDRVTFGLVIIWALIGIGVKQNETQNIVLVVDISVLMIVLAEVAMILRVEDLKIID